MSTKEPKEKVYEWLAAAILAKIDLVLAGESREKIEALNRLIEKLEKRLDKEKSDK